jgi:hypothetical protein
MSFIHDPYYDDTPVHDKIKPRQLVKIPYDFPEHGLAPIDEYIRLSPALDYLKTVGCLVVMTFHSNTLFYCDCAVHLEKAEKMWSESMRYFPLVFFEDHMKKLSREKAAPVKKGNNKLRTLLDELHSDEPADVKIRVKSVEPVDPDDLKDDDVVYDSEKDEFTPAEKFKQKKFAEDNSKRRAEDILKLIRSRQDKKKK